MAISLVGLVCDSRRGIFRPEPLVRPQWDIGCAVLRLVQIGVADLDLEVELT